MSKYEVSTLKKGLQILDILQERKFLTLTEISKALDLNKTTVFRLLSTLESMNYVIKNDNYFVRNDKKFQVNGCESSINWTELQAPYQLGVNEAEGVYIGVLEGTDVVMKQMIKPPFTEPYHPEIGNRSPSHISALGKVILENLIPTEQQETFSQLPFHQATDNTFVDIEMFSHHLDVIKQQGFAIDDEERFIGVRCIAAPVFHENRVVAAVAIAGPIDKMKKTLLRGLTNKVLTVSKEISKELGMRQIMNCKDR
ncbi:IclR family transcriptional regulator [Sporosarcina thermotolerans]|uniref:IclR family transcriptional regulator n=1 Tax=Sporosarcina thermotolerans TaxID=633404 RepID=A0AAW9ABH6_9BACL|nr:IclR family transcriptional regulator [Sporosarcina thermotolerans]MDW0118310.1 IclR family transcriptional regulator [Sporosarcina thermotolerans]WHT48615.1 IclR family transcriptional regulator [Sporosarcina thermotolerans]